MAKESSLLSRFLKGMFGLLTALALFAGEQYIQHHYFQDNKPGIIPVAGRVVDAAGTRAIENAIVQLTIGQFHEDQNTDSEGRYAFSLQGFDQNTAVSMGIDAQGYKHQSMNLLLSAIAEDKEIKLEAQNQIGPGHLGIGAIAGSTYLGPKHGNASVQYIRRINPQVIIAHH